MAERELFDEMNLLIRAIARQLAMPQAEVSAAFDRHQAVVRLGSDAAGRKVMEISIGGRTALVGMSDLAEP